MSTNIQVPALGESITEAIIGRWLKKEGDAVAVDEPLVELETDKVTVEVNAPVAGTLGAIAAAEGETVEVGAIIGSIGDGAAADTPPPAAAATAPAASTTPASGGGTVDVGVPILGESVTEAIIGRWLKQTGEAVALDEPLVELETDKVSLEVNAPAAGILARQQAAEGDTVAVGAVIGTISTDGTAATTSAPAAAPAPAEAAPAAAPAPQMSPAVRRLVAENNLDAGRIPATGKGGRLTKADVLAFMKSAPPEPIPAPAAPAPAPAAPAPVERAAREERVRMTPLRRRVAQRLKEAQNTAAMLTTFNEVDMSAMMATRTAYKEVFEKKHGIRLGFMSFFVKAAVTALKDLPAVNGEIDGDDIIYKNYYDIGVAVSTPQGLVVPVVRDCDKLGFAAIEKIIHDLGKRGRDGKLTLGDLTGGTFTLSNGGVFGSLMSTPILNPPQSAILGMHKIQKRPVAIGDDIVIRPMMYLALSYDHRIVDGREAVTFLVRIKECLEDPSRLLLDL